MNVVRRSAGLVRRHVAPSLLLTAEKVLLVCLLASLLVQASLITKGVLMIRDMDRTEVFVNRDSTSNEQIDALLSDKDSSLPRMQELLAFARASATTYSYWQYPMDDGDEPDWLVEATTDPYFFELYQLRFVRGSLADAQRPQHDGAVPVVVGSDVAAVHPVGSTWDSYNPDDGKPLRYRAVAELEKGQVIPHFFFAGRVEEIDGTYFRLVDSLQITDFETLDMAIGSLVVHAPDATVPTAIAQKSRELGLFDMQFESVEKIKQEYLDAAAYILGLRTVLLLLTAAVVVFTTSIALAALARSEARSFALKLAVGARRRDLRRELFVMLLMLTLLAAPFAWIVGTQMLDTRWGIVVALVLTAGLDLLILWPAMRRFTPDRLVETLRMHA